MIFWSFLISSFAVFGIIRTAILLLPIIFFAEGKDTLAGIWLSFFAVSAWMLPYEKKAFDLRGVGKEKLALTLFLSSCAFVALFYPLPIISFPLGAFVPFLFIRIFEWTRLPISRVYFFPIWMRFVLTALWILCFMDQQIW